MSPPVHIDAAALLAHPLSVENLTLASLGFMNTRASPAPVQSPSASSRAALSTSSWGDEDWRAGASAASDSEWDALSDAGAML
jgi:hypothetical protein